MAPAEMLEVTLAFERLVDAVVSFRALTGRPDVSPAGRAAVRAAVTCLLNELEPSIREAAEERCALYLLRELPIVPCVERASLVAVVSDALADYRHGLQQIAVTGVGRLV